MTQRAPRDQEADNKGKLQRVSRALLGRAELRWTPPPWLDALPRIVARYPVATFLLLTGLGSAIIGAHAGIRWYQTRPEEKVLKVEVTPPKAPLVVKGKLRSAPLELRFAVSAARLRDVDQVVKGDIRLEPTLAGSWRWAGDRRLVFEPKPGARWPVGQKMKVMLAPKLLRKELRAPTQLSFTTAPFVAKITKLRQHEDPRRPTQRTAIATLSFSHPVSDSALRARLAFEEQLSSGRKGSVPVASIRYDDHHLRAFVHSPALPLQEVPSALRLELHAGVHAALDVSARSQSKRHEATLQRPGRYGLSIEAVKAVIVDSDKPKPSRALSIQTSHLVATKTLTNAVAAFLLPLHHPTREPKKGARRAPHRWRSPALIDKRILSHAQRIRLEPTFRGRTPGPGAPHGFRFQAPAGRYLYVRVGEELTSRGGYTLRSAHRVIVRVPEVPTQLLTASPGALLNLRGQRKIGLIVRNLQALKVEVGRILPQQLHHLVRVHWSRHSLFDERDQGKRRFGDAMDLAEVHTKTLPVRAGEAARPYILDLAPFLARATPAGTRHGLFFLRLSAHDPDTERSETHIERLITLTDLGLILKEETAISSESEPLGSASGARMRSRPLRGGARRVFVQSLSQGKGLAGVEVSLLGRNGRPISRGRTDGRGHLRLAAVTSPESRDHPNAPRVYVARRGTDIALLPYFQSRAPKRHRRRGAKAAPKGLTAYVFSDRGLYQPGEELRFGAIVKRWGLVADSSLRGLPVELRLVDPRSVVLRRQRQRLSREGLLELKHRIADTALSGRYRLEVTLPKSKDKPALVLGSTTVEVRPFRPDRLKIQIALSPRRKGWVASDKQLEATVRLRTLYGTAAAGRRVVANVSFGRAHASFRAFPKHRFFVPSVAKGNKRSKTFATRTLGEVVTDAQGLARFRIPLKDLGEGTFELYLSARAFERGGGRSVAATASTTVSSHPYLLGVEATGALRFIKAGASRGAHWLAVNNQGEPRAASGLELKTWRRRALSVLTRDYDGSYSYRKEHRYEATSRRPLALPKGGTRVALDTAAPGTYRLTVHRKDGLEVARLDYDVVGAAEVRPRERQRKLRLRLAKDKLMAGSMLEVEVKAPYRGAGLLTLERDRVYAHRWFRSDTPTSVQRLRIPKDLEGTAYLRVSYIRAVDDRTAAGGPSPYCDGVVSLRVDRQRRDLRVQLDTSAKPVRSGAPLTIRYRTDTPSKVILFGVDEGILRVAGYSAPRPLDHFLREQPLEVHTEHFLDLLLPEVSSAVGGGAGGRSARGANLNPFRRRRRAPVAFWSGVMKAGPEARSYRYTVPDDFNGTLKIMAVAISQGAVGVASRKVIAKNALVIEPNVPPFVAPGDRFTVAVSVANQQAKGTSRAIRLTLKASEHLALESAPTVALDVPRRGEGVARFQLRATSTLGGATLRFQATTAQNAARLEATTSVRPATSITTTFSAGILRKETHELTLPRRLRKEHRSEQAGISAAPMGLANALVGYLRRYRHRCTEQQLSKTVPALVFADRRAARAEVAKLVFLLRARQQSSGAVSLWPGGAQGSPFATLYALHLLLEARERGFAVPPDLVARKRSWFRSHLQFRGESVDTLSKARLLAYGLYLLARSGEVVGGDAAALQERLDKQLNKRWRKDITAAYLAATYRILVQEELAEALISSLTVGAKTLPDYANFYDRTIHDAQLLYLVARHFPKHRRRLRAAGIEVLTRAISEGRTNTLSAATMILALEAYSKHLRRRSRVSLALHENGAWAAKRLPRGLLARLELPAGTERLRFAKRGDTPAFFSVVQSGYDRALPHEALQAGLEIDRRIVDEKGKAVSEVRLGEEVSVVVRFRALGKVAQPQIAVVDLLPAGFQVSSRDVRGGEKGTTFAASFVDRREDRLVLYGAAPKRVLTYRYKLRATNAGTFTLPAVKIESLYDRRIMARTAAGKLTVRKR